MSVQPEKELASEQYVQALKQQRLQAMIQGTEPTMVAGHAPTRSERVGAATKMHARTTAKWGVERVKNSATYERLAEDYRSGALAERAGKAAGKGVKAVKVTGVAKHPALRAGVVAAGYAAKGVEKMGRENRIRYEKEQRQAAREVKQNQTYQVQPQYRSQRSFNDFLVDAQREKDGNKARDEHFKKLMATKEPAPRQRNNVPRPTPNRSPQRNVEQRSAGMEF